MGRNDDRRLSCGSLREHGEHEWPVGGGGPKYVCKGPSKVDPGSLKIMDSTPTMDSLARKYAGQLNVLQQWLATYDREHSVSLTEDDVVPRVLQLLADRKPEAVRQVTLRVAVYDWIENSLGITRIAGAMAAERGLVLVDTPVGETGDEGTVLLSWLAREHPGGRVGAEARLQARQQGADDKESVVYRYPVQRAAWDGIGEEGQKTLRSWLMNWLATRGLGVAASADVEDCGVVLGAETVVLVFHTHWLRLPTTMDVEVSDK